MTSTAPIFVRVRRNHAPADVELTFTLELPAPFDQPFTARLSSAAAHDRVRLRREERCRSWGARC